MELSGEKAEEDSLFFSCFFYYPMMKKLEIFVVKDFDLVFVLF